MGGGWPVADLLPLGVAVMTARAFHGGGPAGLPFNLDRLRQQQKPPQCGTRLDTLAKVDGASGNGVVVGWFADFIAVIAALLRRKEA